MIFAPTVQIPSGRVLAAWWRGLAFLKPEKLWIGNFLFHSIEFPVRLKRAIALDRFPYLVLQGIENAPEKTPLGLALFLSLSPVLLVHVLSFLRSINLVEMGSTGSWNLSRPGKEALQAGSYPAFQDARRSFHTIQVSDKSKPVFVLLKSVDYKTSFEHFEQTANFALLHDQIKQTPEWKKRHRFPEDLVELLSPYPQNGQEGAGSSNSDVARQVGHRTWQRIPIVHCWRQNVALVQCEGMSGKLIGFGVEGPRWELRTAEPLFELDDFRMEQFRELSQEPSTQIWTDAWRDWCQPRGLMLYDSNAFPLERVGHQLKVLVPKRIMDQLRVQRSDALKGDAWLTAGTGNLRSVAQLEIVEKS